MSIAAVDVDTPLDLRPFLRRARLPLVAVVLVLGLAILAAALGSAPPPRALDPTDASPVGALALSRLLAHDGITVRAVVDPTDLGVDAGTTVVLSAPELLDDAELARLANGASDVLLVAPELRELRAFGVDADEAGSVTTAHVSPACGLSAADDAGTVTVDGSTYEPGRGTVGCYPVAGADMLLSTTRAGRTVTVLGSTAVLANRTLADDGNAALGLDLLLAQPHVDWLVPRLRVNAPTAGRKSLADLLPSRLLWALLQALVALLVLALWRGRRLGPIVVERLPVVVRATETVEGRARLMRAARARGRAGRALRAASRDRLARRLGLGVRPERAAVVSAVAAHTDAPTVEIDTLLYGADPADDAALVTLARQLDTIEEEVCRQ